MRYKELFRITIKHPYYEDQRMDIEIYPDSRTERLMKSFNVITKSGSSGFQVVAPVSYDDRFFQKLKQLKECKFIIYPTKAAFIHVTDLKTDQKNEVLHFTNRGMSVESSELKIESTIHQDTFKGFKSIGVLTVDLLNLLETENLQPPNYEVVFDNKTVVWKYYFIHNNEEAEFEISSREKEHSFAEINIENDSIANTLKMKFPDSDVIGFQSDKSIPYSKRPLKDLKLSQKTNDHSISLPNPELGRQGIQILNLNNKV
ncbi:MAG: hypothetical protein AAFQ94_29525 [Bacteroidota bacterium]